MWLSTHSKIDDATVELKYIGNSRELRRNEYLGHQGRIDIIVVILISSQDLANAIGYEGTHGDAG
jgi:hypothetical protein